MGTADSGSFSFALMLAVGLATLMLPGRGEAYTPDQQEACTPDAFRLCGADIPDVDRITACMIRNKALLSPACGVFFRAGPEPREASERVERRPVAAKRKHAKSHRVKRAAD